MFITSCPASNMALPFTPYPTLTYEGDVATNEQSSSSSGNGHFLGKLTDSLGLKARDGHWNRWGGRNNHWGEHWHSNSNSMAPPSAGDKVTFSIIKGPIPSGSYVTFVSGLDVVSVQGTIKGKEISATIPQQSEGQTYVFVTKSSASTLMDAGVLYGPAILEVKPQPPQIDFSQS